MLKQDKLFNGKGLVKNWKLIKPKLNLSQKVQCCFYQLNFVPSAGIEVK